MKKRLKKGEFGYITSGKMSSVIRSIISVSTCVIIFLIGFAINHSNKNAFSIIAALGCLPAGWSVVNMIMFLRAGCCSKEAHLEIENHKGGLLILYDLEMTSEKANYMISAATVLDKNVCCYTEDLDLDATDCEKHILLQIGQSGYSDYTVKVFSDLQKFCDRLDQLEILREKKNIDPFTIEAAWVNGTTQTAASVLQSISL